MTTPVQQHQYHDGMTVVTVRGRMKVIYNSASDVLKIVFRDAPMEDYSEDRPNVMSVYDDEDNLIAFEIREASKMVDDPRSLDHIIVE